MHAKKQAQKEVFGLLDIDASSFNNSEDLNIAGKGDGDGALLAFSVLLQGDRSVAALSELLTKIAKDMEKDGTWDDKTTRLSIADWAADADSVGKWDTIVTNVKNWGLTEVVPEFVPHIRHFRNVEYGLGDCGKDSAGVVKSASAGKRKGTTARYICDSGNWRIASDIEKDTYLWKAGEDGEIKTGSVIESNSYLYDVTLKKWRDALSVELALGGCSEKVAGDISKNTGRYKNVWYKCSNHSWNVVSAEVVDTQGWAAGKDADVKKGDSTDAYYVYDETLSKWRIARKNESELGINGCTKKRIDE